MSPKFSLNTQLIDYGILYANKPSNISSNGLLRSIKYLFNIKKAGFIGILDPFATGFLPIFCNRATALIPYIAPQHKQYNAIIKLGIATTTGDTEGDITQKDAPPPLDIDHINQTLQKFFHGPSIQNIPLYSAKKVDGKALYHYARLGISPPETYTKKIHIYQAHCHRYDALNSTIHIMLYVSTGTYIRQIAIDLADKLGTVGHCLALHRCAPQGIIMHQPPFSVAMLKNSTYLPDLSIKNITLNPQQVQVLNQRGYCKSDDCDTLEQTVVFRKQDGHCIFTGYIRQGYYIRGKILSMPNHCMLEGA